MSRTTLVIFIFCGLALTGCNKSASAISTEAQRTADVLTGDAVADASTNAECGKFTVAEIAVLMGTPVEAGENAAMGTGCQWLAQNDKGFVMVQVVGAKDHNPPSAAPGYKELPDVGKQGYMLPDADGGSAGAIQGDRSVNIMVTTGASEAKTLNFLKEVLKRTPA